MSSIDPSNVTMDWMEQEQERGLTITSVATQLNTLKP